MRAYIFDMDGVLCDSEAFMAEAACRMFGTVHGAKVSPGDFEPFVGTGEDRYLGGVAEKHGVALSMPADKETAYRLYGEVVEGRLHALPGVADFIQSARAAGILLAVATSADEMKMKINLREMGFGDGLFDVLVNGLEIEHKKPAPDIFLEAARRLGVAPSEAVVFEDAVNGVRAAKAAGCRCVGVATSFAPETLRGAGADQVVAGFRDPDLLARCRAWFPAEALAQR